MLFRTLAAGCAFLFHGHGRAPVRLLRRLDARLPLAYLFFAFFPSLLHGLAVGFFGAALSVPDDCANAGGVAAVRLTATAAVTNKFRNDPNIAPPIFVGNNIGPFAPEKITFSRAARHLCCARDARAERAQQYAPRFVVLRDFGLFRLRRRRFVFGFDLLQLCDQIGQEVA